MDRPPPQTMQVYRVADYGNSSPRFLRLTTNRVTMEQSLLKQSGLPLGAVLQPMIEPHEGEDQI